MLETGSDLYTSDARLHSTTSKSGDRMLRISRAVCPNPKCREMELTVALFEYEAKPAGVPDKVGKDLRSWRLAPESSAKVIPDYVPKAIQEDYYEACRIVGGSPKAAATLARRCLQGMIRDFWQIKKSNLAAAIRALKSKVDGDEFDAIDSVRKVGNIGAHMEKNVNHIVDVDPGESEKLLRLIEAMIEEWYGRRHKKAQLLASVREIGELKGATRKAALKEAPSMKTKAPGEGAPQGDPTAGDPREASE
jgi:hypothetical protein